MEESYTEGVAIHGGREPCVGTCEGEGEASVAVRAGWAMEPRNSPIGVPTPLEQAEGNIAGGVRREPLADPARSENLCTYGTSMRENREVPCSPDRSITGRAAQGRLRPHA